MARSKRAEPYLPPGPARDLVDLFNRLRDSSQLRIGQIASRTGIAELVDLFNRLRDSSQLRIGQIASRTGYAPGHISEVLRGWKTPSPDAAAKIAQVLGADDRVVRRARQRAEDLKEWKRDNSRNRPRPSTPKEVPDSHGRPALEIELARAIAHYAEVNGQRDIAGRLLAVLGAAAGGSRSEEGRVGKE